MSTVHTRLTEALQQALGNLWTEPEDVEDYPDWYAIPGKLADVLLALPDIQIDEANSERGTEEYLALRYADDPIEAFNLFIKAWVPPRWHGHLLDDDENDAEFVRDHIRAVAERKEQP